MGAKSSKKKATTNSETPTKTETAASKSSEPFHKSVAPGSKNKPYASLSQLQLAQRSRQRVLEFTFLMIGEPSSGKTSLALRFIHGTFSENFGLTLGNENTKEIKVEREPIQITIVDTAGKERFKTITSSFYRGCHGIIITFDLTGSNPFNALHKWLQEVERYAEDKVQKILVGSKSDLTGDRSVSDEDIKEFAETHGLVFMEASSKSGDRVEEVFVKLTQMILEDLNRDI